MVSGDAGIGKTAVLGALIGQGRTGRARPPRPPAGKATGRRRTGRGPRSSARVACRRPSSARRAGCSDATRRPGLRRASATAADAQFRLFRVGVPLPAEPRRPRPLLVVVLDDLQWSDDPSLRLLGFLARTLATSRVLLLGAYRDLEASDQLLDLAGARNSSRSPASIRAMSRPWSPAIAGPDVAAKVSDPMWRRSGGNPFFVRELTRLLVAQGRWQDQTHIPANIAETLRRRLADSRRSVCGCSTGPPSPAGTSTSAC